jgi:hypothetical protein
MNVLEFSQCLKGFLGCKIIGLFFIVSVPELISVRKNLVFADGFFIEESVLLK